ncbi:MAG TPA: endonuclease/exonuclease/phosphatase family protein [Luteolibacter sp.]|nr:endonuclease/exonuclease/phosphatase family protein [Luteolibacter sp.]
MSKLIPIRKSITRPVLVFALCGIVAAGLSSCRREREFGPPKAVPVSADGALDLKLMTFNVRYENGDDLGPRAWNRRIPHIVRMIREETPGVLGVQEARHGQAADLWASLPDYEFFGSAREDGARGGEYTAIFYRRDSFEPDRNDAGTFWLSGTPEIAGSVTWGNEIPRTVTWLRLTDRATQRSFYVFNTHWDHRSQPSRLRSAELLATRISDRDSPDDPVVLLGDFNALPHNPAIKALVARAGLTDTLQDLHPEQKEIPTLHLWRGLAMNRAINVDHIFIAGGQAEILAAGIRDHDQPMLSDHFPVTARVRFK